MLSVPAALCIYDDPDAEDELSQFESSQWKISGVDIDDESGTTGVMGVAVSNDDPVGTQMGTRIDQVVGEDSDSGTGSGYTWMDSDSDGYMASCLFFF